jgi:hypothetical protein
MPDSAKNGNRHGNDNKISIYAGFAGEISKQGQHLFKTNLLGEMSDETSSAEGK